MQQHQVKSVLKLRRLGIDTYKEAVIYMREDCAVCRAEGFEVQARVKVSLNGASLTATLNMVNSDILKQGEAGLSKYAFEKLGAREGDEIHVSHPPAVHSLSFVRSKIYGNALSDHQIRTIIEDIVAGHYSDIHISSFLTACAGGRLNREEIVSLTRAMVDSGDRLDWGRELVVDKHCVGGLPGNRTTPIVVAIVAAYGLTMPKTSSRAITSPAGTADTMEVLAPVDLDVPQMRRVVEQEGGCVVWGGSVSLSPADDLLIRVEKALDLDSEGQLVASVLSKKIAAGSSHVLIDMPVGPTAKVRSMAMAEELTTYLEATGSTMGTGVRVHISDGSQPVGRGIGPALEARDLVAVLKNDKDAPEDLKKRSLDLAGHILEFSPDVKNGQGRTLAMTILEDGRAWKKFQAICEAQGGMRDIPKGQYSYAVPAKRAGFVRGIDNRSISRLAKLAGAPADHVAGVDLHAPVGTRVDVGQPLFTVYAGSPGELDYALSYLEEKQDIIDITEGNEE
ncbi:thymidine phosphorylase family protein [Luteithermobacter gelatinilyticus]|uniref:thymidine phosphorylase family protein n=1 Tax=Luteithermobacter gelatinilyticus TaxID=2582913 RepID=UPI0011058677|nr:thymidine phosphorylase family protein [Luteithermobacter gelatinilyticus]